MVLDLKHWSHLGKYQFWIMHWDDNLQFRSISIKYSDFREQKKLRIPNDFILLAQVDQNCWQNIQMFCVSVFPDEN